MDQYQFNFIENKFDDVIEAILQGAKVTQQQRLKLLVNEFCKMLLSLHLEISTAQEHILFNKLSSIIGSNDINDVEKVSVIKTLLNETAINQQLQKVVEEKINRKYDYFKILKLLLITIAFLISITLIILYHSNEHKIETVLSGEKVVLDTSELHRDTISPSAPISSIHHRVKISGITDSLAVINISHEALNKFPLEIFTIKNNTSKPILITGAIVDIVLFEPILSLTQGQDELPAHQYSLELLPKIKHSYSYNLIVPLQIEAYHADVLKILFYCTQNNQYVLPYNIGSFIIKIYFTCDNKNLISKAIQFEIN